MSLDLDLNSQTDHTQNSKKGQKETFITYRVMARI